MYPSYIVTHIEELKAAVAQAAMGPRVRLAPDLSNPAVSVKLDKTFKDWKYPPLAQLSYGFLIIRNPAEQTYTDGYCLYLEALGNNCGGLLTYGMNQCTESGLVAGLKAVKQIAAQSKYAALVMSCVPKYAKIIQDNFDDVDVAALYHSGREGHGIPLVYLTMNVREHERRYSKNSWKNYSIKANKD